MYDILPSINMPKIQSAYPVMPCSIYSMSDVLYLEIKHAFQIPLFWLIDDRGTYMHFKCPYSYQLSM